MHAKYRWFLASTAFLAAFALMHSRDRCYAKARNNLPKTVDAIAASFKQGNANAAKLQALMAANQIEDVGDLMTLYRPETKGGLGLEKKILMLTRNLPANVAAKLAAEIEADGFKVAAIAELTLAKEPAKDGANGKTKQVWKNHAQDLRAASLDLAKAAVAQNVPNLQKAAIKMNATCTSCHSTFKN